MPPIARYCTRKLLLLVLAFRLLSSCDNDKKSPLPDFNLLLADSTTILKTSAIPTGRPIVFIFFSPDCEHCQAETAGILQKMDSLKNVRFYFATIEPFDRLRVFRDYYQLEKYPNIVLGRDYAFFMPNYFQLSQPPLTAIYNRHKELQVVIEGETTAHHIIEKINKL